MPEIPTNPVEPVGQPEPKSTGAPRLEGMRPQDMELRAANDRLAEKNRRVGVGLPETATEEEVKAANDRLAEKNRRAT